jgi:hypothetical protein
VKGRAEGDVMTLVGVEWWSVGLLSVFRPVDRWEVGGGGSENYLIT